MATSVYTKTASSQHPAQPAESSASYFPDEQYKSGRSSTASTSATNTPAETPAPKAPSPYATGDNPISPLDRAYAKPAEELDVAKQLAKKPVYWSTHGWLQRTATMEQKPRTEDPEARARKFEEAKKELLASAGRF
ncbi:hypothetical protein F4780DRAFT_552769 [Xylariomycetidae sp. FL0641]|nr:hypothetical protein F4780DRAFT_552769 [Xylariomycetidae sp. FL0641]